MLNTRHTAIATYACPYTTLFRSNRLERDAAGSLARPRRGAVRVRAAGSARLERTDAGELDRERPAQLDVRFREREQGVVRSEEHTSELQSPYELVCRLLH